MNLFSSLLPWALVVAALAAGFALGRRRSVRQKDRLEPAETMLRRISQAVESTSEAVGIGDRAGHWLYRNRAHLDLFGYTVDELDHAPGDGGLFADKTVAQEILAAVKDGRSWSGETDVLTKQGQRVPAFVRVDIIRDEAGEAVGIYGVFANLTERRRQAEEKERASRLESLGLMAGGIAHDFGNMLTIMNCTLFLTKDIPGLPERATTRLTDLETVVRRASKFTEQLKAFAQGGIPQKKPTRLPALVRKAAEQAVTGTTVRIEDALPADLWPVDADEGQLGQVVHTLVLNAVQAMAGTGCMSLRAANLPPGTEAGLPADAAWVKMSLTDTGPGLTPEVMARVFDPSFTTKEKGAGFALATSYRIVEKHQGRLRVESTPGAGTTFHLLLPAAKAA